MAKTLVYTEVFVPGGYPSYTYNPRTTLDLERKVGGVLQNLCKLVIVTGPTKSGKTVLVQKILPREDAIWIDGGGVGSEDDFWMTIVDQLNLFQTTEVQTSTGTAAELSGELSGEANLLFAKGGTKVGGSIAGSENSSSTQSREMDLANFAAEFLHLNCRSHRLG